MLKILSFRMPRTLDLREEFGDFQVVVWRLQYK
jgi:hypothetical protein